MIGNNKVDKITSVNKARSKDKITSREIFIPTEKHQQIIDDLQTI